MTFSRILVANRGAIARRLVRGIQALGLEAVALYSDADRDAPCVEEASAAEHLPGTAARDTYLNIEAVLAALAASGADAVHPGYGFLAENAAFARAVDGAGACFIGPRAETLADLGGKDAARRRFAEHGFPVHPGSPLLRDADMARAEAARIGYPVMVKPAAGGGGLGMRLAADAEALIPAFEHARAVGQGAFGDGGTYLERAIDQARHIEIQVLGDRHGHVRHLLERECSVQRRHQKVIEEAPAPGIDRGELDALAGTARDACAALGYESLGTVETLRTADGRHGFLEINTRIQVEHGVTEAATGLDLVALQLRAARGERLAGLLPAAVAFDGYAMEARVYAEDSRRRRPSTGRLDVFELPRLTGVRVETGYRRGNLVTPYYDGLLAKLIAIGTTREQAIGRLLVATRAMVVRGVDTNLELLAHILQHETFLAGRWHTDSLATLNPSTG